MNICKNEWTIQSLRSGKKESRKNEKSLCRKQQGKNKICKPIELIDWVGKRLLFLVTSLVEFYYTITYKKKKETMYKRK